MAKHHKPTKNETRKKRKRVPRWQESPWEADRQAAYMRWEQKLAVVETKPRRTQTLERLASLAAEHFRPLGAVVELSGASLKIDGVETRSAGDASTTLDAIGLQKYGPLMEREARLEIIDQIPGTESRITPYGLEILQNAKQAALIKASHATLRGGQEPPITGNFLISDGLHWDELRQRLGGPSLVAVLRELPTSASSDDRSRAELASARIRNERSSSWDLEVLIRGDQSNDEIVFSPISVREMIEAPFRFTNTRGDVVRGALRLTTPVGILEIVMIHQPDDELLTRAWLFALRAFADLTCGRERIAVESRRTRSRGELDSGQPRNGGDREQQPASIPRPRSGEPSGRPQMSDRLAPTAATASVLGGGHYVAGHKTRLPLGKRARQGARQLAAALAIALGPNETWTREHWRGIAGDKPTLEFVWREADDAATIVQAA